MEYDRKVKVLCHVPWSHHHSGWPFCVNALRRNFHSDDGVLLYTNAIVSEIILSNKVHEAPWIGFLHAPPDDELKHNLNNNPACLESLKQCQGIYSLSDFVTQFVRDNTKVLADTILLAVDRPKWKFDFEQYRKNPEKRLMLIGHWFRRFEGLYEVDGGGHRKTILRCTNLEHPAGVDIMSFLADDDYEKVFVDNIMFLQLTAASANNVVVECIVRGTPLVVNRLPPVEDYLGKDYPLFYDTIEEASEKIRDQDLVFAAHHYLSRMNVDRFTEDGFIKAFDESIINQRLKRRLVML